MNAVSLRGVGLKYRIDFKEDNKIFPEDFWALQGVTLDIPRGESVCIIGDNGAGKTTLLKIIAGMFKPDTGSVFINGTIAPLLNIGAGFHAELTGKENIYLISSLFGLAKHAIKSRFNDIVEFAALGRFINAPVKSYSQGMYMRLAFAIAIHIEPDILLIDDIFAVGDLYAQRKCIDRMLKLKEKGKSIILVTHNLEIAKRFCSRGVLLKDGKVVQDGGIREVCSYYLETVGDKRGIAMLQKDSLGVIFNNGKLSFSFGQDTITAGLGGYISILSAGNQHCSFQADWLLRKRDDSKIVVEGTMWHLPLSQVWEIYFDNDAGVIDCVIEMNIRQACVIDEFTACIMLRDEYRQWFNPFINGCFETSDLREEIFWQCADKQIPAVNFIGLNAPGGPSSQLPSIAFIDEVYTDTKLLEVHNTNQVFMARALQSRIINPDAQSLSLESGKSTLFHLKIMVGNKRLLTHRLQNFPKLMLPKIIQGKDDTVLLHAYNDKMIHLYWRGAKITAGKGFKTSFYYQGKEYQSSDAFWMIHRVSAARLSVYIRWPGLPIQQIWDFKIAGNNTITCQVRLVILEDTVIRNNEFRVMFSADYRGWFTSSESGDTGEDITGQDFKSTLMKNDLLHILGLTSSGQDNAALPAVLIHDASRPPKFNSLERKLDWNATVFADASGNTELANHLYFMSIDSKESINYFKGSYLAGDFSITIGTEPDLKGYIIEKRGVELSSCLAPSVRKRSTIENGPYIFIFDRGNGRIKHRNEEITSAFGLYTSVYSKGHNNQGQWYVSLDASWEIIASRKDSLLLRGTWPYIPLVQVWEVKNKTNGFIWDVEMEIFESTTIIKQQANIMLSGIYNHWRAADNMSGSFPDSYAVSRWDILYARDEIDRLSAGIKQQGQGADILPGLSFSCFSGPGGITATVENTNRIFKSRKLGFESINATDKQKLAEGKYHYFHGEIMLGDCS
ncbi:MAG: ABC transporter ATP-binding protein [Candidatus Omnitrophota bacterium]